MSLPIALQLYSLRDDLARDFEGTLKAVHEMGYDGVEFAGLFDKTAAEVRALCAKYDLKPVSAHVPFDTLLNDPDGTVALYKEIGCFQVVIPYMDPSYMTTEGMDMLINGARKIGEAAKKAGMLLAYHNHDFEFEKVNGKSRLDFLYETVDADTLKTQIDTCWANVGGVNPSEYVMKYAGRCPTVHLKDFFGVKGEHMYSLIGKAEDTEAPAAFEFRPCGYGKQDMPAIVAASEKAGAKWLIVEQDNPTESMGKTPLECAAMSIAFLKKL